MAGADRTYEEIFNDGLDMNDTMNAYLRTVKGRDEIDEEEQAIIQKSC